MVTKVVTSSGSQSAFARTGHESGHKTLTSRRIQERLGFLSPIEFEEKYYADQATAEPTNLNTRQPALTS
ncbi:hypothetical protein ACFVFJ_48240 [Streptomyces sp. NPDC057717]|uniref:hypothetical protein n=1 Tax=Streptomyces sp. NPDC057717 TaxID=3346224 RepID=UPI00367F7969